MKTTASTFLGHFDNSGIVTQQMYPALTQMENMIHFCTIKKPALIPNNFQNTVIELNAGTYEKSSLLICWNQHIINE